MIRKEIIFTTIIATEILPYSFINWWNISWIHFWNVCMFGFNSTYLSYDSTAGNCTKINGSYLLIVCTRGKPIVYYSVEKRRLPLPCALLFNIWRICEEYNGRWSRNLAIRNVEERKNFLANFMFRLMPLQYSFVRVFLPERRFQDWWRWKLKTIV